MSVFGLWLSAGSASVSPATLRIAAVAGLGFPLCLGGTVLTCVLALLLAPRRCWISLLGLATCWSSIRTYIPWNPEPTAADRDSVVLGVMNYNCLCYLYTGEDEARREALQYVADQDVDIFCYQEGNPTLPATRHLAPDFLKRMPYASVPYPHQTTLQGICSRYPIVRTDLVTSHTTNGVVAFWLALPDGDSLLVLNCHLQSNELSAGERQQFREMAHRDGKRPTARTTAETSRHLAGKISRAAAIRAHMADTVADYLARHPGVRTIVCGDFNDTPISYPARRMRQAGLTDAFREAGRGMGRTFNKDAIAVRIDHQFCSAHYVPVSARVARDAHWSDHYPLVVHYKASR